MEKCQKTTIRSTRFKSTLKNFEHLKSRWTLTDKNQVFLRFGVFEKLFELTCRHRLLKNSKQHLFVLGFHRLQNMHYTRFLLLNHLKQTRWIVSFATVLIYCISCLHSLKIPHTNHGKYFQASLLSMMETWSGFVRFPRKNVATSTRKCYKFSVFKSGLSFDSEEVTW